MFLSEDKKFVVKSPNSYLVCTICRGKAFTINFYTKDGKTTTLAKCLGCGEAIDYDWVKEENKHV